VKNIIKKSFYVGVLLFIFSGVISCEKDFTDIGTSIINNTQFNTKDTILDILITNSPVESVRADGISIKLGQYILGVNNSTDYEKIEASIISQVGISSNLSVTNKTYGADTIVETTIDAAFIKLPYNATLIENTVDGGFVYELDSIIGNRDASFTFNAYQSDTYLSVLNPTDPTQINQYQSNYVYSKIAPELNSVPDYQFKPNANDTAFYIARRLSSSAIYRSDTIKLTNSRPFAKIDLNKTKIKELFLNKFKEDEFSSQENFNNYFRGLILEAKGDDGSLISFGFPETVTETSPSIEVYYTSTILNSSGAIIDTITKNNSFPLNGVVNSIYKMTDKVYPEDGNIKIQGAAGSEAKIEILVGNQLSELREKNWLINDADLTLYINQDLDTAAIPYRLHLYKKGENSNLQPVLSQIKDSYSEQALFGGFVARENNKINSYTFRITDYISDLLSGETDYSPPLKLKVFNSSDIPVSDSLFRPYNWNPKAITILNHSSINGTRKARLKISYSEKKE
jgi:hypothetical protein